MKSDKIICLGKTDNGLIRQEWYDASTKHGQLRNQQMQDHPEYETTMRNVGSKSTIKGQCRVIEITIKGKEIPRPPTKPDEPTPLPSFHNTSKVPLVQMFNGKMA